jgi:hypothetical protein
VGAAALYILSLAQHYARAARERRALALEKERLDTELSLAARIQANSLPKDIPERGEFAISASMTPMRRSFFNRLIKLTSRVVFPEPGEDIKLIMKMPFSFNSARNSSALLSLLANTDCLTFSTRTPSAICFFLLSFAHYTSRPREREKKGSFPSLGMRKQGQMIFFYILFQSFS